MWFYTQQWFLVEHFRQRELFYLKKQLRYQSLWTNLPFQYCQKQNWCRCQHHTKCQKKTTGVCQKHCSECAEQLQIFRRVLWSNLVLSSTNKLYDFPLKIMHEAVKFWVWLWFWCFLKGSCKVLNDHSLSRRIKRQSKLRSFFSLLSNFQGSASS